MTERETCIDADDARDDPLCVCGHRRSQHAAPTTGDTRCLVVVDRRERLEAFNARPTPGGYCACLRAVARPCGGREVGR